MDNIELHSNLAQHDYMPYVITSICYFLYDLITKISLFVTEIIAYAVLLKTASQALVCYGLIIEVSHTLHYNWFNFCLILTVITIFWTHLQSGRGLASCASNSVRRLGHLYKNDFICIIMALDFASMRYVSSLLISLLFVVTCVNTCFNLCNL